MGVGDSLNRVVLSSGKHRVSVPRCDGDAEYNTVKSVII